MKEVVTSVIFCNGNITVEKKCCFTEKALMNGEILSGCDESYEELLAFFVEPLAASFGFTEEEMKETYILLGKNHDGASHEKPFKRN